MLITSELMDVRMGARTHTQFVIIHCRWYQVNTGAQNRSLYQEIEQWGPYDGEVFYKDLAPLHWWKKNGGYRGSNVCNEIRGTDGTQFHPDVREDDKLYIFSVETCSSIFLEFEVWRQRCDRIRVY